MKNFILAAAIALSVMPALANDEAVTYPFEGSFDDATFAVESAIVGRGLVIDYVSHTGQYASGLLPCCYEHVTYIQKNSALPSDNYSNSICSKTRPAFLVASSSKVSKFL